MSRLANILVLCAILLFSIVSNAKLLKEKSSTSVSRCASKTLKCGPSLWCCSSQSCRHISDQNYYCV